MNIEKHLRQLHKIQPDPAYARQLRARLVLAASQPRRMTFQVFLASVTRSGFAAAAIGLLLFLAIGGSIWNLVFSPITNWDAKTLLAEAQAINIQIRLADLQFNDPGYERERLVSPATDFKSLEIITGSEENILPVSTPAETATASSTEPSIDSASSEPAATPANSTSTQIEPDDGIIDVEEALDILSH